MKKLADDEELTFNASYEDALASKLKSASNEKIIAFFTLLDEKNFTNTNSLKKFMKALNASQKKALIAWSQVPGQEKNIVLKGMMGLVESLDEAKLCLKYYFSAEYKYDYQDFYGEEFDTKSFEKVSKLYGQVFKQMKGVDELKLNRQILTKISILHLTNETFLRRLDVALLKMSEETKPLAMQVFSAQMPYYPNYLRELKKQTLSGYDEQTFFGGLGGVNFKKLILDEDKMKASRQAFDELMAARLALYKKSSEKEKMLLGFYFDKKFILKELPLQMKSGDFSKYSIYLLDHFSASLFKEFLSKFMEKAKTNKQFEYFVKTYTSSRKLTYEWIPKVYRYSSEEEGVVDDLKEESEFDDLTDGLEDVF